MGILTTDEKCEAITKEISGGVYILKEIKVPEGYKISEMFEKIILDFEEKPEIEKVITNEKS